MSVTLVSADSVAVGIDPETATTTETRKSKTNSKAGAKKPRRRKTPKLSHKERCRINRINASHSTGPRTDQGKRISSANAVQHGLCIENFALASIEDKEALRDRLGAWESFYEPASPAEAEDLEQAVYASHQRRRSQRCYVAAADERVRNARRALVEREEHGLIFYEKMLKLEPREAVFGFKSYAMGCR
jgi:hypothetical protein